MTFRYAGDIFGEPGPIVRKFVVADTEVLSVGEFVNLESGEAASAAAGDTALIGACVEAIDNSADGLSVRVITNPGAIYAVDDANVRSAGDTLDIASGALGVAASSSTDFVVVADSTAAEPTLVTIIDGSHYLR